VAEKPVVPVGRDLGHRARQSRVAAGGRRVLGSARRLEVLDLSKTTVVRVACGMCASECAPITTTPSWLDVAAEAAALLRAVAP
jgi:hypothetical protein